MGGLRDYHTKSEREGQIPCGTTFMWNLKYDTDRPMCEIGTDPQTSENGLAVTSGEARRGGIIGSLRLADAGFYTEWGAAVPTDSIGGCSQRPVTNHNGEEYRKYVCVCVCVCVKWSHFTEHPKLI